MKVIKTKTTWLINTLSGPIFSLLKNILHQSLFSAIGPDPDTGFFCSINITGGIKK
jgi:hypothetical protein